MNTNKKERSQSTFIFHDYNNKTSKSLTEKTNQIKVLSKLQDTKFTYKSH